jgi:hypothetical protein
MKQEASGWLAWNESREHIFINCIACQQRIAGSSLIRARGGRDDALKVHETPHRVVSCSTSREH